MRKRDGCLCLYKFTINNRSAKTTYSLCPSFCNFAKTLHIQWHTVGPVSFTPILIALQNGLVGAKQLHPLVQ